MAATGFALLRPFPFAVSEKAPAFAIILSGNCFSLVDVSFFEVPAQSSHAGPRQGPLERQHVCPIVRGLWPADRPEISRITLDQESVTDIERCPGEKTGARPVSRPWSFPEVHPACVPMQVRAQR